MVQKRTIELWVGIFIVAGLLAVAMLAFRVGNLGTGDVVNPYNVTAQFQNIGGLKVRAPVTMAGVRIGRVVGIKFDDKNYVAVVTLAIDGRYHDIPVDSSAAILTSGLLGEQYIGLQPGGSETFLKNGGRIQVTQSAMILENLIGQLMVKLTEGSGTGHK